MQYSNGKTPQPGDIIAADISGSKYPFVVVALTPVSFPGSGVANPPEQFLVAVPFAALKQINFKAGNVELWSDAYPDVAPIAPPLF